MICPNCNTENNDGIKFCTECGTKLMINCPSCNSLLKVTAKFCTECGYKFGAPKADDNAGINVGGKIISGGDVNQVVNHNEVNVDNSVHNNQVYYGTQEANTTTDTVSSKNVVNSDVLADEKFFELGKNMEQAGNYSEAENCYTKAAEMGNKDAIDALCEYYMGENCVNYDIDARLKWNKIAMGKNIASGFLSMGYLYHFGDLDNGISIDEAAAENYYKKGAALGNENCAVMLKKCFSSKEKTSDNAGTQQKSQTQNQQQNVKSTNAAGIDSGFDDIFASISKNQNTPAGTPGKDLYFSLKISPQVAATGKQMDVNFSHMEVCLLCNGTGGGFASLKQNCSACGGAGQIKQGNGFFTINQTCSSCHGDGFIWLHKCDRCQGGKFLQCKKTLTINIPAGTQNGNQIKIQGQGDCSTNGGPAGDLYLTLNVE